MLRLAICDDDRIVIEQLETYIDQIEKNKIEYDVFYSAEELYHYKTQGNEYQLYILDIEMTRITGLKLAKMLREDSSQALIVFLTSYSQYVYDVFEVVTFDFIIKPITFERFEGLITKATEFLKISCSNFIFSYRKNTYSIPYSRICYIEKNGRKAFIHEVTGETYQFNMVLAEIWEQLDLRVFASIHTSCIINLAEIISIESEIVKMKNQEQLYVSRNYRQKIKQQHLQYLKELM